ncbi:MAG: elongation factor G [bacterium]|nr:elongation factor G [bacterium]
MKRPPLEMRRNFGIISHIDAGKTTTTERILFYSGTVHRIGEVDEGQATTDWMAQERERGISITAAAITCLWGDYEITLIDTPGHVDFTIEVERSLRVLDGAIAIFSAVEGVEPQSETVWHQAEKFRVPRLTFINKLDRLGADFERTIGMMREKLGARPVLMQWPDGEGSAYTGQVDVLTGDYLTWSDADEGRSLSRRPAEGALKERAAALRDALIEAAADFDEALMAAYLEGGEVSEAMLKRALRKGTLAGALTPVFCGSSLRNRGVQPLLDAVVDYLPSPLDVPSAVGRLPEEKGGGEAVRPAEADAPFAALVFKVQIDEGRRLTYLRVYSGQAKVGDSVWNPARGASERLARLFRMYSHKRERIEAIGAGDIVAAAGLKGAATGDTLCTEKDPILFESISAAPPVISVAIEPRDATGAKKLGETLDKLEAEDPTFHATRDEGSGQIVMSGMGELHLDVLARRILDEFGVPVRIGRPRVVYRETIKKAAEAEAVFDRELGGKPQFARIRLRVSPAPGAGVTLENSVPAGAAPAHLIASAEAALRAASSSGYLAGYEMTDIRVELIEAHTDERGTEAAFGIAAGNAFGEACRAAGGQLLEPVMAVEVATPEEFTGAVIGDLNGRGGRVGGMEERGGTAQIVRAQVSLAQMFGYATALRSATQGRATYTMAFSHYEACEMAGG